MSSHLSIAKTHSRGYDIECWFDGQIFKEAFYLVNIFPVTTLEAPLMPEGIRRDIIWNPTLGTAVSQIAAYLDARPFPPPGLHNPDGLNRSFVIGSALLETARHLKAGGTIPHLEDYVQRHALNREGERTRLYMHGEMQEAADAICMALLKLPDAPATLMWKGSYNQTLAISIALYFSADLISAE